MDYLDHAVRSKSERLSQRIQAFNETKAVSLTMAESESGNMPQEFTKDMSERVIAPKQTKVPMEGDRSLAMTDRVQLPKARPTVRVEREVSTTMTFADRSSRPVTAADQVRKNIY